MRLIEENHMKLSARNVFKGKVLEVKKATSITNEAVEDLRT